MRGETRGKLLEQASKEPITKKKAKPATDGALGSIISSLAGAASPYMMAANAIGMGIGFLSSSEDKKEKESIDAMNNLRASLSEWHTLE